MSAAVVAQALDHFALLVAQAGTKPESIQALKVLEEHCAAIAQRAGSGEEAVPPASGKSPCIEDRDGLPAAMRTVIQSNGSVEALRGLYRLVNIWGAEQRAAVQSSQPDSGRDAALNEDTELLDWFDTQVEAYGFEGVQEGNRWAIDGPFRDLRHALRECKADYDAAMAAQQGEKGGA